ncbi:MAG: LysR family transcriptional regulator [Eubacterium sp.]
MNLNLEYYKVFYYVAKYKSITLAAEKLSLSQPAVSQSIRHLEEEVGTPLFVRTAKGMRLTTEGEVLYPFVARGYEYIRLGERKLLEQMNLEAGEIRIGASDMTLQFYLLRYLEQFHEKYPKVKVRVTDAPTPETLKHLQDGKIDFGVVTAPVAEENGFTLRKVRDIQDVFVAGEKYSRYLNRTVKLSELEDMPVICLERETSSRTYVESFLEQYQVSLHPEFELATSDMLIQFAVRGLGVANVVDFCRKSAGIRRIISPRLEQEIPKRAMYVVTNERIPLPSSAGHLIQMLEAWDKT